MIYEVYVTPETYLDDLGVPIPSSPIWAPMSFLTSYSLRELDVTPGHLLS
jgi:hypothetical protein